MSDVLLDSSIVAKWFLLEDDSSHADLLLDRYSPGGDRLLVVDLVFAEVANAIWKRHHRGLMKAQEVSELLEDLFRSPLVVGSVDFLRSAMEIAIRYDRAIYDALFVAAARQLRLPAITADEPLYNAVHRDYPEIVLLRDWRPPTANP